MKEWLKSSWNKLVSIFKSFVEDAVTLAAKEFIAEFKDLALSTVTTLATSDLSSADKRKEAFEVIKNAAIAKGKSYSDNTINLLIELAVSKIKQ